MDVWCVSSHEDISSTPVERKGVKLHPADLTSDNFGIWCFISPKSLVYNQEEVRYESLFGRSAYEENYLAALRALFRVRDTAFAVVSMGWSSRLPYGLLVPERAWLVIYDSRNCRELLRYTHTREKQEPLSSFMEVMPWGGKEEQWYQRFSDL